MSSSKRPIRQVPPPPGTDAKGSVYSRFIPREELNSFSAWTPGSFGDDPHGAPGMQRAAAEPPAAPPEDPAALLHAARQQGYQDGYRDGMAALEQFKQSYAMQLSTQFGALLASTQAQLDALQQQLAQTLAVTATQLARQVVRSELSARPELVVQVAQDALDTLLLSARHITLRVHPDDHAVVAQGAAEVLSARGARLLSDGGISRGGCVVESDIGVIDAGIESRWRRAAAAIGCEADWDRP